MNPHESTETSHGEQNTRPTLRDLLMLEKPESVKVSPNGARVAYGVRTTNWKENRYETICHVHRLDDGATHPINRSGSASQIEWVDDNTLALLKRTNGGDDKAQVWLYEGLVGEGWAVTDHKTGVNTFKPFAGGLLFLASDPERDENKSRGDRFGKFTHFEQEESASALYYTGLAELRRYQASVKAATEDEAKELVKPVVELSKLLDERWAIKSMIPSPTGDAVYLNCWRRDDLVYRLDTQVFRIALDAGAALAEYIRREEAKQAKKKEVSDNGDLGHDIGKEQEKNEDYSYLGALIRLPLPRGARVDAVSPDGRTLLIGHQGRDVKMYTLEELWLLDVEAALQASDAEACLRQMRILTGALDRTVRGVHWVAGGIYGGYPDGAVMRVARFSEQQPPAPLDFGGVFPAFAFHISDAGRIAMVGANSHSLSEVYVAEPNGDSSSWPAKPITEFGRAAVDWDLGTVETIRWRSKDGAEIEGVLRKPKDFDPAKRYPLAFVVHGGPTWFSSSYLLDHEDMAYYPVVQLLQQDVLVLKPNYRGSIGYGQAFMELNVNNLGVGDLWDLESAINHLAGLGWVDPARVGCMGWSQGGYISAFAGLHSERFRAVSVGAGISDWYTYHVSNDIPHFTVDYLSGSPFRSRDLYARTAPISNLANARTPMLIQHGSDDRRVPLSNAMELYRGLKEMGVPVELFVYPGMGHPITKPRENHAVLHQNLAWFGHYLLGRELKLE
jgi:dipeptidyl aminopeptidase/acylaminoacyl peptidase